MRMTLAKCLLGPLLLWQGRRVRATALRLPEAAGERAQPGGGLRLLIVGDSSAAGVGAPRQQETLAGCPRGYALWAEALADQIEMGLGLPSRSMAT